MGLCRGALDLIAEHRSERAGIVRDAFERELDALG